MKIDLDEIVKKILTKNKVNTDWWGYTYLILAQMNCEQMSEVSTDAFQTYKQAFYNVINYWHKPAVKIRWNYIQKDGLFYKLLGLKIDNCPFIIIGHIVCPTVADNEYKYFIRKDFEKLVMDNQPENKSQ